MLHRLKIRQITNGHEFLWKNLNKKLNDLLKDFSMFSGM